MATFTHGNISISVDEDGFMQEPENWNEDVAKALATTEGVNDLAENHWKVVNYLRKYYLDFGVAPMIRKLCKETGAVPLRSGQGRLQGRRPAEAHRLRLRRLPAAPRSGRSPRRATRTRSPARRPPEIGGSTLHLEPSARFGGRFVSPRCPRFRSPARVGSAVTHS